jgi:hypothetical protein
MLPQALDDQCHSESVCHKKYYVNRWLRDQH